MTATKQFRTIFFGSLAASADVLSDLLEQDWLNIVAVVSQAPKEHAHTTKRDTPVTRLARERGLRVFTPTKLTPEVVAELKDLQPDVGVLFAYGKILPDSLLELFPHQIINIHPSLLPRHRGPSPLEATLLAGDTTAGTTIMLITSEMDAGPVLAQISFPISSTIEKTKLWDKLVTSSRQLLIPTLQKYLAGQITPQAQSTTEAATYSHLIKKSDGDIDPARLSAVEIERSVRAYHGWPGSRLHVLRNGQSTILTLHVVTVREATSHDAPPYLRCEQRELVLHTHQGDVVIERAQLPARHIVSGRDLCNQGSWELDEASEPA